MGSDTPNVRNGILHIRVAMQKMMVTIQTSCAHVHTIHTECADACNGDLQKCDAAQAQFLGNGSKAFQRGRFERKAGTPGRGRRAHVLFCAFVTAFV